MPVRNRQRGHQAEHMLDAFPLCAGAIAQITALRRHEQYVRI